MGNQRISYKRHRFPPQIIAHTVWLYARFNLSLREVEELMLERGVDVSYGYCHINSPSLHDGMAFVDQATFAAIFHAANASNR